MWSLIPAWHVWYFANIGIFGHLYVCFMLLPGKFDFLGKWYFPGNETSREMWLAGKEDFGTCILRTLGHLDICKVTSRERWLPGKGNFPGKAKVIVRKWPYNTYFRLKQGCLGQHNIRLNLEHPQMNIRCIAAAGSWRTFPSCFKLLCHCKKTAQGFL